MQRHPRNLLVIGILLAAWGVVVAWQVAEHFRVRRLARADLINNARNISSTVGTMVRLQRRWWGGVSGTVSKERLELQLTELLRTNELNGIALLNEAGEVVASAGMPLDPLPKGEIRPAEKWESEKVTLLNLVALGTNVTHDLEGANPAVIVSFRPSETNRPPPPGLRSGEPGGTNVADGGRGERGHEDVRRREPAAGTNALAGSRPPDPVRARDGGPGRPPRFGDRPPWMSEEEYRAILQKQGVHSFAIIMSTRSYRAAARYDLWLRSIIGVLATVSVVGSGMAWSNLVKSSDLQIRLVRTSELNTHLKELNLAAAGLAHETRNPLNIIRGLAQMISKQGDASEETRRKSRDIINEADRVTAQLNEFINYSKPREVRRSNVALGGVVNEVVRALNYDIEEKLVRLQVKGDQLTILADEQLLRQALFNLLLNSTQAVEAGGEIEVEVQKSGGTKAVLEVRDNGPGVPADRRTEIFKPYFTTHQKGTGLGLAVVQQIVLAHGWEIECLPNDPHGAIFRISHLKLAS